MRRRNELPGAIIAVVVLLAIVLAGSLLTLRIRKRIKQERGHGQTEQTDQTDQSDGDEQTVKDGGTDDPGQEENTDQAGQEEGSGSSGQDGASEEEAFSGTGSSADLSLEEFCADEELSAWFDSLEQDTPVNLDYWIFGEAPEKFTTTDPDLILRTAYALRTVRIGGVSEINPNEWLDADGDVYYFTMEDGRKLAFSFMMQTFKWDGEEYHDVTSFGDLTEINEELVAGGYPQTEYVYSADRGFYTSCLETYRTEWVSEDEFWGGLFIRLDESEDTPFVEICRYDGPEKDPETYLTEDFLDVLKLQLEEEGKQITSLTEIDPDEYGGLPLAGATLVVEDSEDPEEGEQALEVLALQTEDSLLRKPRIVRFCALYDAELLYHGDEGEIMDALNLAVREFHLKHVYYEKRDPQPGNTLRRFCNSDELNAWLDNTQEHLPDSVTLMTDTWYMSENPATVRAALDALQTVGIGEMSSEIVGASGRRIYTFTYNETGDYQDFTFFMDNFEWENTNYKVLNWGALSNLDERIMADHGND